MSKRKERETQGLASSDKHPKKKYFFGQLSKVTLKILESAIPVVALAMPTRSKVEGSDPFIHPGRDSSHPWISFT
jgi:hypothetical protein